MPSNTFISKFLKGSAFTSLGTIISVAFHFISTKILAEYMPKEAFGIYMLIVVISHGFQILGGLGVNLSLVKNLAENEEEEKREIVTAIFLSRFLLLGILSVVVIGAGHLFLPLLFENSIADYILYVPIIFFLASFRELLFYLLQGVQQFNRYALINVLSAFMRVSCIGLFSVFGELTILNLVYVEIITYGFSLLLLIFMSPFRHFLTTHISRTALNKIFSFSLPLYANDILTYIYNKVSVLLIAGLLTPVSVAKYEIASKIPEGLGRLFSAMMAVYFPSMTELLAEGQKQEANYFLNRGLILASTTLSLATLVAFLFRDEIVLLLFSEQYLDTSFALALLILNFNISAISRMMGYTIVAAGHSSVPVRVNFVASAVNIVGCLLLIPVFGFMGAIYSIIAVSAISQLMNYFFLMKAGLRADLWGISKSLLILIVLCAGYLVLGNENIFLRISTALIFMLLCWLLIPEVKKAFYYVGKRVGRFSWKPT